VEIITTEYKVEQFDGSYKTYILRYGIGDVSIEETLYPEILSLKDEDGEECYYDLNQFEIEDINNYLAIIVGECINNT